MQNLLPTLLDYDPGLLAIIAHRWDVDLDVPDKRGAAELLAEAMLDPERAAVEWGRLNDQERGALQTLLGAPNHKMSEVQFSRLFGEIRQMGPGRRDREKPHLSPVSVAETLFYRGLLALAYDQGKAGMQAFVFVPPDLADALPSHETGFNLTREPEESSESWPVDGEAEPDKVTPANTTLVDDMATLLAYLQIERVTSDKNSLREQISAALASYWLGGNDPARVALLISLAGSMGLAASEDGVLRPVPSNARRWLEETRPRQVRALVEAWRDTTLFNDLWYTPGLRVEETGWRNDPLLARQTILTFLEMVPPDEWWPIGELIEMVKVEEPDFQRPAGDYESWYIRDAQTGDYLRGFASWEQVDGAVLRFILNGPMHWLGLVDLGQQNRTCRLSIYGRAFCGETDWPDPAEDRAPIVIQPDGVVTAPRTVSRYERFQLARITEWRVSTPPYTYALTAAGLRRGARQGIAGDAVQAFLRRASHSDLPAPVLQMIERWEKTGKAEIWLSRAVILRANSPEALQSILETPELRRYLGAALGPNAVLVRAGQEADLAAALSQRGILAEFED